MDGVTRRVETYDTQQLFYDFNEAKKVESRATEAVLNALILASVDAEKERRVSSGVIRRAFQRMWQTQRADGAWDWLDFGLEPFESAGATYYGATLAAMAVGSAGPAAQSGPTSASTANAVAASDMKSRRQASPLSPPCSRSWLSEYDRHAG